MELNKLKEGKTVSYKTRFGEGRAKIIEIYKRKNGVWLVGHDRKANKTVSLRPGQVSA